MQPGMPNLQQIVLQAQQMQAEMERAQESLAAAEVTGTAGGGLVTAVVAGGGELRRIRIDPSVVDPADVETLEDLVVAAVHDARRAAEELVSDTIGSVAGGLAGSLDLSSLDLSTLGLPGLGGFPGFGGILEEDDSDDRDDDTDDPEVGYDSDDPDDPDVLDAALRPGELPPGDGSSRTGGA